MLLECIFPDAEGLGDFIVVAVLVDLFGDLEFSGGQAVLGFQAWKDV